MITRIPVAIDRFGALVHGVPADLWDAPTPCSQWTVRDLVNHLVSEHAWAPHLLAGETIEQVGDRYDGDLVGSDPAGAWDRAAARSRPAWEKADLSGTARFSFGEAPLTEYADQMLVDLTVHGWDLARATGQDEAFDPEAVERALAYAQANVTRWDGLGIIAPPVPTTSDDPAVRLICLTGRAY
ncbi:TIGR03086 family metal-binding protein [Actinoplanes sp. RD1]|uniref:TIGR03086 family metal-binding protein n=1 Tax=Actinoplanes sp. RD1 TaxID=3064538 RepID=UPI0027428BF6|nr:TIGR03086 family metal-binding protein [Actinoplanes sp. RD1]